MDKTQERFEDPNNPSNGPLVQQGTVYSEHEGTTDIRFLNNVSESALKAEPRVLYIGTE